MKNNSWKCFREEKPDEKKWILMKSTYTEAECEQMELKEDFQKQDYYAGVVIGGLFLGGTSEGTLTKAVDEFTNEEWRYVE